MLRRVLYVFLVFLDDLGVEGVLEFLLFSDDVVVEVVSVLKELIACQT